MSHWEEKYQANTIPRDRGASSPALHRWLAADALKHGRILVPGRGHGHEAVELARHGFQVTGLDIAPTPRPGGRTPRSTRSTNRPACAPCNRNNGRPTSNNCSAG